MGTTAESDNSNPATAHKRRRSNRPKHSFRVLLCDSIDQAGADILSSIAEVDSRGKMREEELLRIIGDYHALVVRSGTSVSEKVINQGRQLKIIGRAGVGVDNVCVDAATAKGIFVVNSPHGNTVAAAELTLGLMMCLARRIPQADASVARGEWKRSLFIGRQLQQKTIGIIGLGQVGTHVARVCQALGMHILVYDPFVTEEKAKAAGCRLAADLPALLSASDVVTLHVPLLDSTRHLINRKTLELTKKGFFLINASRGEVVDEDALAEALMQGHVGGAALDVFEHEGEMHANHPLLKARNLGKNVLFTPHIGASTAEAQHNVAVDVALQVKATLLGGTPAHAINLQVVQSQHLKEHLLVADVLGRLCSRLVEQPVQQLHLRLRGEAATLKNGDADALLLAAAQGMLRTRCDGVVNFVNVKRVAQEHRLQLVVSREAENSAPQELIIEVTLQTTAETATVSGCSSSTRGVVLKSFLGTVIDLPIPIRWERSGKSSSSSGRRGSRGGSSTSSSKGTAVRRRAALLAAGGGVRSGGSSSSNAVANDIQERTCAAAAGNGAAGTPAGAAAGEEIEEEDEEEEEEEEEEEQQAKDGPALYMMYTLHRDQPGTLASVAQLLADAGVNVANCHLGRRPISLAETEEEEGAQDARDVKKKGKGGSEELQDGAGAGTTHPSAGATGAAGKRERPAAAADSLAQDRATLGAEHGAAAAGACVKEKKEKEEDKTGRKGRESWMGLCIFLADNEIKEEVVEKIRSLRRVYDCKVFATPQTLGAGRHTLP